MVAPLHCGDDEAPAGVAYRLVAIQQLSDGAARYTCCSCPPSLKEPAVARPPKDPRTPSRCMRCRNAATVVLRGKPLCSSHASDEQNKIDREERDGKK